MSWIGPAISVGGGLLSSLFGGPSLPPEVEAILRKYMAAIKDAQAFGKGIPLSDAGEQAALAEEKGLAGGLLNSQNQALQASYGPQDAGNRADFQTNMAQQNEGQLLSLDAKHLLASLQARQNVRFNTVPQMLQGAAGIANGARTDPSAGISQSLGQLAQSWSYNQARNRAPAGGGFPNPDGPPAGYGAGNGPQYGAPGTDWGEGPAPSTPGAAAAASMGPSLGAPSGPGMGWNGFKQGFGLPEYNGGL